ncbi:GNAT family N-acetyltransferase [Bacillus sp. HMF5848]|uniref:GNAT family N-acetyltransferase n=1 Tax=Bacillus sp. HMF5848 TaxID=2495421 RepID=UPI000F794FE5|nr:GNAT family N-acetyltransferase [Bacillus sp. HMF5848]RSK28916.1 GNAT family N-acetyltransferase [Bacillus sp. HMF5848]
MTLSLKEVTKENWEQCIALKVAPEQESFVASNLYSLAEAHYETSFIPKAVYSYDEMIGFLMLGKDPDDGVYWIVRLMIDERYQGKGYGHQAVQAALAFIKKQRDASSVIRLGVKPENVAAKRLYKACGFSETGHQEHGEDIMEIQL